MLRTFSSAVRDGGRGRVLGVLAVAAAVAAAVVLVVFITQQQSPPSVSDDAASSRAVTASPTPPASSSPTKSSEPPDRTVLASTPTSISIPGIGVDSPVISIGKTPSGELAVPEGEDIDKVAWFENSPTPGQAGPSVVEGHIDTVEGPSVFFRLASLTPGDDITVDREDGSAVTFSVTEIKDFPDRDSFPTELVYGGDLGTSTLRLITCSNFDTDIGHYVGNTIVFAEMTKFEPAG